GRNLDNFVGIDQVGVNNEVGMSLGGANDFNTVTIVQSGEGNRLGRWGSAGITLAAGSSSNVLLATQIGDLNAGTISIDGSYNAVTLDQLTDGNVATFSVIGDGNTASVTQQ